MHDRRIDGVAHVFGNAGTLFRRAMTWYDHETGSIWSQPWGQAIFGELKGVKLRALPAEITTWETWRTQHPGTLALANDLDLLAAAPRQLFQEEFVIGLSLGSHAKAYHYRWAADQRLVNDQLGPHPILLLVAGPSIHAYLRQVGERTLTFRWEADELIDEQTGTTWDAARGLGTAGELSGEVLPAVPWVSAYDWAWTNFYPDSEFAPP